VSLLDIDSLDSRVAPFEQEALEECATLLEVRSCLPVPQDAGEWVPQWAEIFPPHGHTLPPEGLKETKPFALVYSDVTTAIRKYYAKHPEAKLFLEYLIESFYEEYLLWTAEFPERYLSAWHRKASGRAYRLIGHAYLHIAWDLPRVVAECMPEGRLEAFQISEEDAAYHFGQANAIFRDVLHRNLRRFEVAGLVSGPGRLFSAHSAFVESMLHWIITMRMTAWLLGASLARQTAEHRAELVKLLQESVEREAHAAIKGSYKMAGWAGRIAQPAWMFSFSAGLVWLLLPGHYQGGILAVAGILASLAYLSAMYRGTVSIAKNFGDNLNRALGQVLEEARLTEPPAPPE